VLYSSQCVGTRGIFLKYAEVKGGSASWMGKKELFKGKFHTDEIAIAAVNRKLQLRMIVSLQAAFTRKLHFNLIWKFRSEMRMNGGRNSKMQLSVRSSSPLHVKNTS